MTSQRKQEWTIAIEGFIAGFMTAIVGYLWFGTTT